jgi:acetyl-CoA acyltransferase
LFAGWDETGSLYVKQLQNSRRKTQKLRFKRPDELAAETIQYMMNELPDFDKTRIDDVMVGNAMLQAEVDLIMGTFNFINGLKIEDVPGVTVKRYCASLLKQ